MQVMILEKSGDGWWRGQYGNKVAFDQNSIKVFLKSLRLPGRVVSVELHAGGDRRPTHLLHGGERPRRHGETSPWQSSAVWNNMLLSVLCFVFTNRQIILLL